MATALTELNFAALWDDALSYGRFVDEAKKHQALWRDVYRLARIPDWALDALRPLAGHRILAIAEDWCGDAFNTVPILARLCDLSGHVDLRMLRRDEHAEVMDHYLTNGTRSIPIVLLLDQDFNEVRRWGPRPAVLQEWYLANREMPKDERYPIMRRWYARDRGESMLQEVLGMRGKRLGARD